MQLAMEETVDRIRRDAHAIRWLVENMTEDSEMELLAMTIPGSFNTEWGTMVWKKVSEIIEEGNKDTVGDEYAAGQLLDANSPTAIPIIRRSSHPNIVHSAFGSITRPVRTCIAGGSSTNTTLPLQMPVAPTTRPSVVASVQGDTFVRELSIRIAFPTCWSPARTVVSSQVMSYGGDVRGHVSRPRHRSYSVPMLNFAGLVI